MSCVCKGDFHVRCCAHTLNLIVQEGLKATCDDALIFLGKNSWLLHTMRLTWHMCEMLVRIHLGYKDMLGWGVKPRWLFQHLGTNMLGAYLGYTDNSCP
ncbi:hypothetical protein CR513_61006, partial [Mucuna pruriens]